MPRSPLPSPAPGREDPAGKPMGPCLWASLWGSPCLFTPYHCSTASPFAPTCPMWSRISGIIQSRKNLPSTSNWHCQIPWLGLGHQWVPSPACSPHQLPPISSLPIESGCKASTWIQTDRQTDGRDRQTAASHSPLHPGQCPSAACPGAALCCAQAELASPPHPPLNSHQRQLLSPLGWQGCGGWSRGWEGAGEGLGAGPAAAVGAQHRRSLRHLLRLAPSEQSWSWPEGASSWWDAGRREGLIWGHRCSPPPGWVHVGVLLLGVPGVCASVGSVQGPAETSAPPDLLRNWPCLHSSEHFPHPWPLHWS